jgi:hypothetical protein
MSIRHRVLSALTVSMSLWGLLTHPAQAAAISITPGGSQMDSDPLRDYAASPGETVVFTVALRMPGTLQPLTDIQYTVHYDTTELLGLGYMGGLNNFNFHSISGGGPGTLHLRHKDPTGYFPEHPFTDEFSFTALAGLKNDGLSDFWVTVDGYSPISANVTSTQTIDVQPIPEPATVLLLCAGLGVMAWRAKAWRGSASDRSVIGPDAQPA